jgi:hypothetical protein
MDKTTIIMEDTNVGFCNDSFEKEKVSNLISKYVINLPVDGIEKIYEHFISQFEKDNVYSNTLVHPAEKIKFPFEILPDWELFGIDFPSWFGNYSNKKIMVIGIDPLRNIKTFENYGAKKDSEVIIGTPYALHDKKMRVGKTKLYWDFVNRLSKQNFVYLTDIYKIYFNWFNRKTKSNSHFEKHEKKSGYSLLKEEINIIGPDYIVAFGKIAQYVSKQIAESINVKIIEIPHPSARPKDWQPHISVPTNENKLNYMVDKTNQVLIN